MLRRWVYKEVSGDFSGTQDLIRTIDFYKDSNKHKNNCLHGEYTNVKIIDYHID